MLCPSRNLHLQAQHEYQYHLYHHAAAVSAPAHPVAAAASRQPAFGSLLQPHVQEPAAAAPFSSPQHHYYPPARGSSLARGLSSMPLAVAANSSTSIISTHAPQPQPYAQHYHGSGSAAAAQHQVGGCRAPAAWGQVIWC
jgi:hypothetical protein